LAERRIRQRVGDASDADPAVAAAMAADFAPWPSATVIDTSGTVVSAVTAACVAVARDFRPWPAPAVA
jgi:predicted kinase